MRSRFSGPIYALPESHLALCKMDTGSLPVDKAVGAALSPTHFWCQVWVWVKLHMYQLCLPDCHVKWRPLSLSLHYIGLACTQSITEVRRTGSASNTGHIVALQTLWFPKFRFLCSRERPAWSCRWLPALRRNFLSFTKLNRSIHTRCVKMALPDAVVLWINNNLLYFLLFFGFYPLAYT